MPVFWLGRQKRRGRADTLAVALCAVLALGGCAVGVDPQEAAPEVYVEPARLTSSAAAKDAAAARDAAKWAQRFVLQHSFDERFMDPGRERTEQELVSAMAGSLSPAATTYWQAQVAKALGGDEEALATVRALTYLPGKDAALRPVADVKPVQSQEITDVEVSVDPETQLFSVSLDYGAVLRVQEGRKPVDARATKRIELLLRPADPPPTTAPPATALPTATPSSAWRPGEWVIEGYDGDVEVELP